MAAAFSTALDIHLTIIPKSNTELPIFFKEPVRVRRSHPIKFNISCNSNSTQNVASESLNPQTKTPSLSDQLKHLSSTTLPPTKNDLTPLLSKPKSTWVNPANPKRSVLSLQRHKRSTYTYNPQLKDLKLFARKLNDCDNSEEAFLAAITEIPHQPNRENALLILNSLKFWQKSYFFFNWIKCNNLFPMETIFYNVTMKSLRFGRQYHLIEQLANEMVSNEIELDNITYSTIITCAKRCNLFHKAIEWFERMYKTGLMPDEVTYSAILDVYAKFGKVEEVLSLYERGVASGWKPDPITFSVLGKMFGEAGDYDGIRFVLQEMKSLGVQPNLVVYNTLLEALGKAGKPGLARSLFDEMVESSLTPDEKTLTALIKIYGKSSWAKDALQLWERMRANKWPMDLILYNTLLNMCADIGLVDEAESLFEDMKQSEHCKPDGYTYTAMLNIHGSEGNVDKAIKLFEEMSELGVAINIMGCTCLIQCLGKAGRIDDLVRVFGVSVDRGVQPDDRLCGCLLSVVSLCETNENVGKVITCLLKANPKLVAFLKLIEDDRTDFENLKEEFRNVIKDSTIDARRPFCNCLIDICRSRNLHGRAHELLYLGSLYGLYPDLHNKTGDGWSLDVRSLSVGAALTALEEWMGTLAKIVERKEELPQVFLAHTGAGTHKFSLGLATAFASHINKLAAPFRPSEDRTGSFMATREDLVSWVQSKPY